MKKFLFFLLFLTGCGFTPLYSQNQNSALKDVQIEVMPIAEQYGAKMRRIIQNALPVYNQEIPTRYQLVVQPPVFSAGNRTITNDEFASMMQITAQTSYQLIQTKSSKVVFSNTVSSVSSYAVVKDPYATTIAKNHIQKDLAEQLAQQISLDVLSKLSEESL